MLKLLNYNKKNSLYTLETILNLRKSSQNNQTASIKKIIKDVKKKRR